MTDGSFDDELDEVLGEPTVSKVYEYGANGEGYVLVTLTNGEDYALDVKGYTWKGQPLVGAPGDGSVVSPAKAAAELEYRVKFAKPTISLERHHEMATLLSWMTETLDALGLELFEAKGGSACGLRDMAWDACDRLRDLGICLEDMAVTDHAGNPNMDGNNHIYDIQKQPPCRCEFCTDRRPTS